MSYWGEIRTNWRFLAAASIGQAAGYYLLTYVGNVFTPHLMNQFGWSRSNIAFIGIASFVSILGQPVAGRLTDAFGVRRMAMIGVVGTPIILFSLSRMTGQLFIFFLLTFLQVMVVGGTTTGPVYSRLIAYRFRRARGIALAIAACAPAVVAAMFVPFLSELIDAHGWRTGYIALAAYTGIAGVIAILLIPAGVDLGRRGPSLSGDRFKRYGAIARDHAFQLIIAGCVLCSLSITMQATQLKVILLDRGIASATGSLAVSLYAFSVVAGRLLCGVALDRFPVHAVAAISLGLPGVGLIILSSGTSALIPIVLAILLLGLSLGAEGDVVAYLVMRFFKLEIYSTVLGLVFGALALSVAGGSLLLSVMLKLSGSFAPFLVFSGISALIGSVLFFRLKRVPAIG
ncbi:MAG: MFS transporter [Steroidobacteraceae bacterium]